MKTRKLKDALDAALEQTTATRMLANLYNALSEHDSDCPAAKSDAACDCGADEFAKTHVAWRRGGVNH